MSETTAASSGQTQDRIHGRRIGTGGIARGELPEFLKDPGVKCAEPCEVGAERLGAGEKLLRRLGRQYQRAGQPGPQYPSASHFSGAIHCIRSGKLGRAFPVRVFGFPIHCDCDYAAGLLGGWGAHLLDIAVRGMSAGLPVTAALTGREFFCPTEARHTPDSQTVPCAYPTYTGTWESSMGHIRSALESDPTGPAFCGREALLVAGAAGWQLCLQTLGSTIHDRFQSRRLSRPDMSFQPGFGDPCGDQARSPHARVRSCRQPRRRREICQRTMLACHSGNVASRFGRHLHSDTEKRQLVNEPQAQVPITRSYHLPWRIPEL